MPIGFFQTVQKIPYFHRFTFGAGRMPHWARFLVGIFAIPSLALAALSLFGFLVSILALLLLAGPVYLLLRRLMVIRVGSAVPTEVVSPMGEPPSPGVKRVESTIVE